MDLWYGSQGNYGPTLSLGIRLSHLLRLWAGVSSERSRLVSWDYSPCSGLGILSIYQFLSTTSRNLYYIFLLLLIKLVSKITYHMKYKYIYIVQQLRSSEHTILDNNSPRGTLDTWFRVCHPKGGRIAANLAAPRLFWEPRYTRGKVWGWGTVWPIRLHYTEWPIATAWQPYFISYYGCIAVHTMVLVERWIDKNLSAIRTGNLEWLWARGDRRAEVRAAKTVQPERRSCDYDERTEDWNKTDQGASEGEN